MRLNGQRGESLVSVMIAVAVLAALGVIGGRFISSSKTGILSAKKQGAVSDLDGFLRRRTDCRKTVATHYAACQSSTFTPLPVTYSNACSQYQMNDSALRADLAKGYDIADYTIGCRKVAVGEPSNPNGIADLYEVSAVYKHKDGKPHPLFTPPMVCEVKLMPATRTFSSGWEARGFVVANFQWLPYDDAQGHPSGSFWVQPDTIAAVCQVAGYRNFVNLPPKEDYTSCGDNSAFWWNKSTKKFVYENACAKNGQLWHGGAVTCKDPIGGVQPCP